MIQSVFERRLLAAVTEGADTAFISLMNAAANDSRRRFSVTSAWRDQVLRRYEIWQGKRRPDLGRYERRALLEPEYLDSPTQRRGGQPAKRTAAAVLAGMRAKLVEMAEDDLTEAQAAHAERYLADEPGLGSFPFDRRPDRARLPGSLMPLFGDKPAPSA